MNEKGFTMVELLAVVVILAILLAFAIPAAYKYLAKSKTDAMETMAKASFEAAHSKAASDVTLYDGKQYKLVGDLVNGGFMDKTIDPDDNQKVCDGEVKITLSESATKEELNNYVYRVHVKCSKREIERIYTTDGQEIDADDNFPYIIVTVPVDGNIQFKNSTTYNLGKVTIKAKNESVDVIQATYSSQDTTVCTVDSTTGVITPVKVGDCKIKANIKRYDKHKNLLGEKSEIIDFKVVNQYTPAYNISYTPTDKKLTMENGTVTQGGQVTVTATNASLETHTTTFSSSDTNTCIVDNTGKVTPKKSGSCTITATIVRRDSATNELIGRVKEDINYTVSRLFTVHYKANGGSGTMADSKCTEGSTITTSTNQFTRTGYNFSGWSGLPTDNKCTGEITLNATWTPGTYTVTYSKGDATGGTPPSAITCKYGNAITLSSCGLTKTGHTCSGWSQSLTSCPASNVTLTPKWTANTYTISYAGNGNTGGSTAASTCTYGTTISPRANGFTKDYFHFTGWTYPNGSTTCNGPKTLTANWAGNTVSIAYKVGSNYAYKVPSGLHVGTTSSGDKYIMDSSNSIYVHVVSGTATLQASDGFWNVQNNSWLYLKKSSSKKGTPKSGKEWKGTDSDTNGCRNKEFSETTNYHTYQVCNNKTSNCVCRVRVNWS